ncbi:MAG: type II secretion system minor pseudopilin GspK [Ideonella sp.]|nr:type II secretion system minor pseudopilin GspK [Ideonella sp.]
MVLMTVVVTLAAGMVWQQWRSIQVESAERGRTQAAWIVVGALDWARLVLREQKPSPVALSDAWAQPLAETRLSTFLATDRDNNADSGPEAFLSGQISDAQGRYNLRNVIDGAGKVLPLDLKVLERICQAAGLPSSMAGTIAQGLVNIAAGADNSAPLPLVRLEDLAWIGVDAAGIEALRAYVVLLPDAGVRTKLNLNTAPREVLAAVVEGMDLGAAERLVQARQRKAFATLDDAGVALANNSIKLPADAVDVSSAFFEVRGRLRLEDRVLEELSLVQKTTPTDVVTRQRQRVSVVLPGAGG